MEFYNTYIEEHNVRVQYSIFNKPGEKEEFHLLFIPESDGSAIEQQLANIQQSLEKVCNLPLLQGSGIVLKRYFLSDAANQYSALVNSEKKENNYAVSVIQQPPLNGSKVALWVYMAKGIAITGNKGYVTARSNGYQHIWAAQLHGKGLTSYDQTSSILSGIEKVLENENCSLKENCIRTWFFVHNVDINYCGVVEARKEIFSARNMVPQTHYISSTGIEGRNNNPHALVIADAYSIKGLKKGQIEFLQALTHLNPTYEYGVTFERGTAVNYGDRKHIYISGTASINNKGEIVHPNNVLKQAERAMQNVEALLQEANAQKDDIAQMIVYLRDVADYSLVDAYFETHYTEIPKVLVLAPVCRPGWLIEIECIAIVKQELAIFGKF